MALTPLQKTRELYADFHKDLTLNPVSLDLARKINEESIKESIKNLLLTDKGERFYRPNLGSDIRKLLFDNLTLDTIVIAEEMIKSTIRSYEPRCDLIDVDVTSSIDDNTLYATVIFSVTNREDPITLTVVLDRVR